MGQQGEVGRVQVVVEEMQSRVEDSNCKVSKLKRERRNVSNKYKGMVSHNSFRRKMTKILSYCKVKRENARRMHNNKVMGLVKKYGGDDDNFELPDDVKEFEKCKIFEKNVKMKPEDPSGPVIVCEKDEDLSLKENEWALLAKGPKYCVVRGCKEEDARVEIETCILKHKWDCMSNGDEEDDDKTNKSEEEIQEENRVAQLAEEMAAQTRMVYNEEGNTWDARGLRVTDYKHNSRVIFPKAQPGEKENNLEVMRSELLHHHREWVSANCKCGGEQKSNLSIKEQEGLKSIRKRVQEGSLVILATDKSGRFAVMSMATYIKAGMVHIKDDQEVGPEERKANQKIVNGAVSMLLKIFQVGSDSKHEGRWRESMLSNSLEACPLWLLFKDHKSWSSSKGTPPPTRPVMGGNAGMNTHLSEILSWILEPLANAMMSKSSEVISYVHIKHKIDKLNEQNEGWTQMDETPAGESQEINQLLDAAPGLCGCEECMSKDDLDKPLEEEPACQESEPLQFVTDSVRQRGNRNKARLIREKREAMKEKRTNKFKRCDRVKSTEIDNQWVQDRGQRMVIIGSDAVSLYPNLTKQESTDEVAEAALATEVDWKGVNWKEATRFLVLGRSEAWCRSSKLWKILPRRRYKHGTKPGLTGAGPLGAVSDDEIQWEFRGEVHLTKQMKNTVMAEVLRLSVELMYDTHIYTFGGRCYKQKEGGPIGLR